MVPEAIEGLKCLVELDLSKNELDFVPSGLKALGPTLEVLTLDDNPIIELNEESFSGTFQDTFLLGLLFWFYQR